MALYCTPENFRAEMSRNLLFRRDVCDLIQMNRNQFTDFVNGSRPLTGWAAHNIGWGINKAAGKKLFDVDMTRGVLVPERGRPPRSLGVKPYVRRSRRRRRKTGTSQPSE